MRNINIYLHTAILLAIQIIILDNLNIHSYVYINVYPLVIFMMPTKFSNLVVLFYAFVLGMVLDIANNTMGIHIASCTLIAYIRPRLLMLDTKKELLNEFFNYKTFSSVIWFMRYVFISTFIFNIILQSTEAFNFKNIDITIIRIVCSTILSIFVMCIYLLLTLSKSNRNKL